MTSAAHPSHSPDRPPTAWTLLLPLALAKLVAHLLTTGRFGYGFFVDELYFLACAEHLDRGFVDMPPLFPAVTALVRLVLGGSLLAVRIVPALAGAALVLLAGLLAREMGGSRRAQALSALAVLVAPAFLLLHSIHTMNALEALLVTGLFLVLLRLANGGSPRLWLAFGLLAGAGLLNKHTMALWAVGAVVGILATPRRRHLATPWPWLGAAVAVALFLPNLVWMVEHDFPHLEMLRNIRADGRDVALSPLAFLTQQVLLLHPLAAPIWAGGLVWLLAGRDGRRYRSAGVAYLVVLGLLLALGGRVYYLFPAYPALLAAGSVALEGLLSRRALRWPVPAYAALLAATGAVLAPFTLPCLPPETYVRYAKALHVDQPRIENHRLGPLPQLHADRFGWPEMAAEVARVYRSLPAPDRERACIFGQNYGQAGAIDLFGPALGLPKAISAHLTYFIWGPRGCTGDVLIVLDDDRETLERYFRKVEPGGRVSHRWSMPYQQFDVWICRDPFRPLAEVWPQIKSFG